MIKNFVYESNKVFVDYKKNKLYLIPQLKEIQIGLIDNQGVSVSLESFLQQASHATNKEWDNSEALQYVCGVIQCANSIPHSEITTGAASVSFMYGVMFERLRQKKGLIMTVKDRQMSSEEMDQVIKKFDREMEATDGSEEE